jgi:NAD(P)-dependent dehydrogenase (short-subunit alcohol dehydrogenase family)
MTSEEVNPRMYRDSHGCRRFSNKTALVTAGTAGIGLAACHRLCSEGCTVFLCSRKLSNVTQTVEELRKKYGPQSAYGMACNVTKPGELEKFVEAGRIQFKDRVDLILSNVGVNPTAGKALEMTDENYEKIMEANVKSHYRLIKLALPYLVRDSSIVLVSAKFVSVE